MTILTGIHERLTLQHRIHNVPRMFFGRLRSKANGIQLEAALETLLISEPLVMTKGIDNTDAF